MNKFAIAATVVVLAAFTIPAFAATNPFMDVPASHWAYDAVAQLAGRGVISGYPDGSYKGTQPATRYEMASIIVRALAKVDLEKASKQDVEMLKRLIVEFKDELGALGVKEDELDGRIAVLEDDIGGWSLSGQLRFDANFGTGDTNWYSDNNGSAGQGKNQFDLNRYRLFINKRINENTYFTTRIGTNGKGSSNTVELERYNVTMKLGWDVTMVVGLERFDWEADLGLYADGDGYFGDYVRQLIQFKKDWGFANTQLVFARENDQVGTPNEKTPDNQYEQLLIAGLANFNINEKFRAGLMFYYHMTDDELDRGPGLGNTDHDLFTMGGYMGLALTPSIEVKGIYYHQSLGDTWARYGQFNDSANAWKVILDIKQPAVKYSSLWLEYGQIDNNFVKINGGVVQGFGVIESVGVYMFKNKPFNGNTTKLYGITARQQWNDKWRTYLRYYHADFDTPGLDEASNWTVGVGYRLNPAVEFMLAYDNVDFGDSPTSNNEGRTGDDHQIRLRTVVSF
jgi:hypothetical protein